MNEQKLFTESGKFAGLYFCKMCKRTSADRETVYQCCVCQFCKKPYDRKTEYTGGHARCWGKHRHQNNLEKLENAELVEDFDGPIYFIEGYGQDGYVFSDVEEVLAEEVESPDDWPEFAHCTIEVPFPETDIEDIIESYTSESYEDSGANAAVPQSLVDGIKEFNALNKHLKSFDVDYKRKVRLPPIPDSLRRERSNERNPHTP